MKVGADSSLTFRFNGIFHEPGDAILVIDGNGRLLDCNDEAIRQLGYDRSELSQLFFPQLLPSVKEQQYFMLTEQVVKNPTARRLRLKQKAGSTITCSYRWFSDIIQGDVIILSDLMPLTRVDTSVGEDGLSFRSAFGYSPLGTALVNADGSYKDVNESLCGMLGYARQELLKKNISEIIHADDRAWDEWTRGKLMSGEIMNASEEKRYCHKTGEVIWISLSISTVRDDRNGFLYFIVQAENISKRKENELELERSEQQFKSIFRQYPDAGVAFDLEGYVVRVNDGFVRETGYSRAELLGRHYRELYLTDDEAVLCGIFDKSKDGLTQVFPARLLTRGPEVYEYNITNIPIVVEGKIGAIFSIARNVTLQNHYQRIVVNEQKRFSDMFFEAPVSMCILKGPNHIFEKANELYCRLSGRYNLMGRSVREVFPEAEGQGIFEMMDEVFQTGRTYSANERIIRLDVNGDGILKDIYLNFMFQPYRDKNGQVEGIFFFGVDVTEQVFARLKVQESEGRYRQIVETAQEGIWLLDSKNRTVFLNRKMADILEYPHEQIIGRNLLSFCDPEMEVYAASMLQSHTQFSKHSFELQFVSRTGKKIWASLNSNSVVDEHGNYSGCLAMVTDVTEKKRVADELMKLSLIARNTVNAVSITNDADEIEWVNESFMRITGYRAGELVGRSANILYGELSDQATRSMIRRAVQNQESYECEIIKYKKSGTPFWVKVQGQPLFDDDGKLTHYFVLETDITELKKMVDRLRETENEVRTFAMQLNDMLESERRRIAREIHDELGQQLAGLKMLLSSLSNSECTTAKGGTIINEMRQSLDAARASIRNLATELRPGILDTLGLIPSIEWLSVAFEKKSGIPCVVTAVGDEQHFDEKILITFFRICQEALTNILKHARASAVTIEIFQTRQTLYLKISDNGVGLPSTKINDPFSMGLIGMRERAKLINARFSVENNHNCGTTIYLLYKNEK